ncbi:hypothetical protein L603_005100000250 [Cellulosimicrobium cellulans J34]|nr:hypothetical protein L603_005100000250 [Cellulosimicrobium cellulans J34]SMF47314.1 hypothetical protein SAMN02744115_03503 [Cellulosimicrobium cellulans J1]
MTDWTSSMTPLDGLLAFAAALLILLVWTPALPVWSFAVRELTYRTLWWAGALAAALWGAGAIGTYLLANGAATGIATSAGMPELESEILGAYLGLGLVAFSGGVLGTLILRRR